MKTCTKCQRAKSVSEFSYDRRVKSGLQAQCKSCSNERARAWWKKNGKKTAARHRGWMKAHPGRHAIYSKRWRERNPERSADSYRKHKYGITGEKYRRLLEEQGDACAICRERCKTGRRLAVDHDHETGRVRGLLCRKCNGVLGLADDDLGRLRSAVAYLEARS